MNLRHAGLLMLLVIPVGCGAPSPPGADSRVIVGGAVALIGSGPDSCTNQVSARGDRWCGFARPTPGGLNELWVIDATRAAAGAPIVCDGSDDGCLRLSAGLFTAATNDWAATGA